MGTFGTDISDNDEYMDLELEFFQLYNEGFEVSAISSEIIQKHNESLNSNEDSNNFWLALADFQWQCKGLDEGVLNKIKDIVESESDLKLWKELDADEEDIHERKIALDAFLDSISTPVKRAKKRVKKKLFDSVFKKGDCLIFKLKNDNYGAALVLDDEYQTEFGLNTIVVADISKKNKPKIEDIRSAQVQYFTTGNEEEAAPFIYSFYGKNYNEEKSDIKITRIANVELKPAKYEPLGYGRWRVLRNWNRKNNYSKSFKLEKMSRFLAESNFWTKLKNWL